MQNWNGLNQLIKISDLNRDELFFTKKIIWLKSWILMI